MRTILIYNIDSEESQTNIRRKKDNLQLWIEESKSLSKVEIPITLVFRDVKFVLWIYGNESQSTYNFLKQYYQHIPQDGNHTETHEIHLFNLDQNLQNPNWSTRWPFSLVEKWSQREELIIERDFVAIEDTKTKVARVWLPEVGPFNSDSLDNFLLRTISKANIHDNSFLFHSATVIENNEAYVFYGPSGAGKSTLAVQCSSLDKKEVISEDRTHLFLKNGRLHAHGVPINMGNFDGFSNDQCRSQALPVKALTLLVDKGSPFKYEPLGQIEFLRSGHPEVMLNEFNDRLQFDLLSELLTDQQVSIGKMCYKKGQSFWQAFKACLEPDH